MPIHLHPTAHGAESTATLLELVASAKHASPLTPVSIVVPTNFVGISMRRALAADRPGGIIGLTILTPYRLAELLGAGTLAAAGRRPVSTPVIGAAIRQVLAREPGLFHLVHDHPSTEKALVRAHRELSELTDDARDRLAVTSSRSAEVVRVHRATRALLAADWYDEADLMAAAAETAATSTVLDDLGTVVLHLPQQLSPATAELIRALAERTEVHVVAALSGHPDADADVITALRRLDLEPEPPEPTAADITRIVTVSDADEEARTAVAELIAAARDGVPLERMAVLYPSTEPYARILSDHLDAAGIPWNGRAVRPLADRLAGRWLLDLLALADSRWARPRVLGLFTAAPLRRVRGHAGRVARWERISREAGIVDGRDTWAQRLEAFAADRRANADRIAERSEDGTDDWRVERAERDIRDAEELAEVVEGLQADLDTGAELGTWRELAEWASWMVANHLGSEAERTTWPWTEQQAAQKVEDALDRLASLDRIESATDLATFTRSLELELDDDLDRSGRFGEGVLVGTIAAGLGLDLDVVVVLGMAEGVLPTRPREDSLLADADREVVADQLPPRSRRVGVEHRRWLSAIAASRDRRILVFPRGDLRRSVERAPSRWLRDEVERRAGQRDLDGAPPDLVTHVASHAGRIARTTFANDEQELLLGQAARLVAGGRLGTHDAEVLDPVLGSGARLLAGRGGPRLTPFNGDVSSAVDAVLARVHPPRQLSASRIEDWLSCPHKFLLRNVLKVTEVENPEEQLTISARDRGILFHDVLERWLAEQLALDIVPAPQTAWPGPARVRLLDLAGGALDHIAEVGVIGHPTLWRQERVTLLHEFVEFLAQDDVLRAQHGLTPVAVEAAFGSDGAPPLELDLGEDRRLRFSGKIDRLDRTASGGIVVTDYKSGSARSYKDLGQDNPDAGGSKVQLMLYGLAARQILDAADAPVHAQYWFTSFRGQWDTIGYDVNDEVVERLLTLLRLVDDQIRAGHFPQRPEEPKWRLWTPCIWCEPDELGTASRHREFEQLLADPRLADWTALVTGAFFDTAAPESEVDA